MADQPHKGGNGGLLPTEVAFDYVKSEFFRVVHSDGVIGGITPPGNLHFAFYSERPPIPKRAVHKVSPTGQLGEQVPEKAVIRDAFIREMDVDVVMSLAVAESFHAWLGQRIEDLKKVAAGGVV